MGGNCPVAKLAFQIFTKVTGKPVRSLQPGKETLSLPPDPSYQGMPAWGPCPGSALPSLGHGPPHLLAYRNLKKNDIPSSEISTLLGWWQQDDRETESESLAPHGSGSMLGSFCDGQARPRDSENFLDHCASTPGPTNTPALIFKASHPSTSACCAWRRTCKAERGRGPPVGHPQDDILDPHLTGFVDDGLEGRNHDLTALQAKPLL